MKRLLTALNARKLLRLRLIRRIAARLRRKPTFDDGRSRTVVLLPHCALNQNARMDGTCGFPATIVELVAGLMERKVGMLQMPCPELCAFGLDRTHVEIERELRTRSGRLMSRSLARELVAQIEAYRRCGIRVLGILGKNGSPSCGVEETWKNGTCAGRGAFIEELAAELQDRGVATEMTGIVDHEPEKSLAVIDRWLGHR